MPARKQVAPELFAEAKFLYEQTLTPVHEIESASRKEFFAVVRDIINRGNLPPSRNYVSQIAAGLQYCASLLAQINQFGALTNPPRWYWNRPAIVWSHCPCGRGVDLAARVLLLIDGGSLLKRLIIPAMAIVAIVSASAAEAKPKKTNRSSHAQVTCDMRGCSDNPAAPASATRPQARAQAVRERAPARRNTARVVCTAQGCSDNVTAANSPAAAQVADANGNTPVADANGNGKIVGGRPAGCPHQFCGCVASLYLFGEIRPELNLAANWKRKFPRTEPASGMVAARNGHVMVLMSHASGDEWLVHDGNSGGGRTREHVRSIRGYTIVNPRATVTAQN